MFSNYNKIYLLILLTQLWTQCMPKAVDRVSDGDVDHGSDGGENHWFNRLAINLLSYSLVLIPSTIVVLMVKRQQCLKSVSENYLIKLFVFGKNETIIEYNNSDESDLNEKLLPLSLNDTKSQINGNAITISMATQWLRARRVTLIVYCFLGLQISYLSWGLLQEKIMTTEYVMKSQFLTVGHKHTVLDADLIVISSHLPKGIAEKGVEVSNNENLETSQTYHIKFRNSQFLVLINRILAFLIAFIALQIKNRRNRYKCSHRSEPPLHQYIYCSLSNILSSWCQYEALKFVSFPTQVLSKACKIMPVMLMSQLVGGKKYRTVEYLFAISISLGMTIFLMSDRSKGHTSNGDSDSDHYYGGLAILVLYLTFDSFTSNWQTVLFDRHRMSTLHMMAAVNCFSILLTATSLLEQGDLIPSFQLVAHNRQLLTDCVFLSIFSAIGQLFVFYTIATFGALVFVTIMTLRQAIAILLSCIVYNHPLAPLGLCGVVIVFATLFIQIYWKSTSNRKR